MSTRSSIFYGEGIHLYTEVMSEELCIELNNMYFTETGLEFAKGLKRNEKYESLVISREALIGLRDSITKYLEKK